MQSVLFSLAVDDSVLQDWATGSEDDCFVGAVGITTILEIPAFPFAVILHARIIIAFVEILEDGREDFWILVCKVDPLVGSRKELITAGGLKERRVAQNVFMCGEQTLLIPYRESDDGTAYIVSNRILLTTTRQES